MEWSFRYEGPKDAATSPRPGCTHCIAAAGFQPQHTCTGPGCPVCGAASEKRCQMHGWGCVAKLEACAAMDLLLVDAIKSELANMPAGVDVLVSAHGSEDPEEGPPRALRIEILQLTKPAKGK